MNCSNETITVIAYRKQRYITKETTKNKNAEKNAFFKIHIVNFLLLYFFLVTNSEYENCSNETITVISYKNQRYITKETTKNKNAEKNVFFSKYISYFLLLYFFFVTSFEHENYSIETITVISYRNQRYITKQTTKNKNAEKNAFFKIHIVLGFFCCIFSWLRVLNMRTVQMKPLRSFYIGTNATLRKKRQKIKMQKKTRFFKIHIVIFFVAVFFLSYEF